MLKDPLNFVEIKNPFGSLQTNPPDLCLVDWTFICLWKNHLYDHIYIPELNLHWPTPCRPTPPPWSPPCQPPGWPQHEPHCQTPSSPWPLSNFQNLMSKCPDFYEQMSEFWWFYFLAKWHKIVLGKWENGWGNAAICWGNAAFCWGNEAICWGNEANLLGKWSKWMGKWSKMCWGNAPKVKWNNPSDCYGLNGEQKKFWQVPSHPWHVSSYFCPFLEPC